MPEAGQAPSRRSGRWQVTLQQLLLPLELLQELLLETLLLRAAPAQLLGLTHPQQGLTGAAMIALQPAQGPGAEICGVLNRGDCKRARLGRGAIRGGRHRRIPAWLLPRNSGSGISSPGL